MGPRRRGLEHLPGGRRGYSAVSVSRRDRVGRAAGPRSGV